MTEVSDAAALQEKGLDQPYASIDFDFHLHADKYEQASEVLVERNRAAA